MVNPLGISTIKQTTVSKAACMVLPRFSKGCNLNTRTASDKLFLIPTQLIKADVSLGQKKARISYVLAKQDLNFLQKKKTVENMSKKANERFAVHLPNLQGRWVGIEHSSSLAHKLYPRWTAE